MTTFVFVRALAKAAAAAQAKDLVDLDSTGGFLADMMAPATWGGERAGRTQAMADAVGEDTTFGVRHPLTQTIGYGTGGSLAGAGLGAGIGLIANAVRQRTPGGGAEAHLGALLGGALGGVGGVSLAGLRRRNEMRRINQAYEQARAAGRVNPKTPALSALAAVLLPSRGPHRTGQIEATRAMRDDASIDQQHRPSRDLLYALGRTPTLGEFVSGPHMYAQNFVTHVKATDDQRKERREAQSDGQA